MSRCVQGTCDHETENQTCTNMISQYSDVTVPIRIKPCVEVGNMITACCGDPTVTVKQCQNANCTWGCELLITQCICVQIPMEYSVVSHVGAATFECKKHSICKNNE